MTKTKAQKRKARQRRKERNLEESRFGKGEYVDVGPKRRLRLPEQIESFYADKAASCSYYEYFRSVSDPWSGSGHLPQYDNFPSVPVTLRKTLTLSTDSTHGTTGIFFCPCNGRYLPAVAASPTTVTWGTGVDMTGVSELIPQSQLRYISSGLRLTFLGDTTATAGTIRMFTIPVTFGVPTDVDGDYARTMSEYLPIGPDYQWIIQGYDNRCEEYVDVTSGPAFHTNALAGVGFILSSPSHTNTQQYRVDLVANYEYIPFSGVSSNGVIDNVVMASEGNSNSVSSSFMENMRNAFEGIKGLARVTDANGASKKSMQWSHDMARAADKDVSSSSDSTISWDSKYGEWDYGGDLIQKVSNAVGTMRDLSEIASMAKGFSV